jgi:hypothetical protein
MTTKLNKRAGCLSCTFRLPAAGEPPAGGPGLVAVVIGVPRGARFAR